MEVEKAKTPKNKRKIWKETLGMEEKTCHQRNKVHRQIGTWFKNRRLEEVKFDQETCLPIHPVSLPIVQGTGHKFKPSGLDGTGSVRLPVVPGKVLKPS
jgi:hypothetical protein